MVISDWSKSLENLQDLLNNTVKNNETNNKNMSDMCFWMNKDKSVVIDMTQIISIIRLEKSVMQPNNRKCDYGIYTTLDKSVVIPITEKEHQWLVEALQEEYQYYEIEEDEEDIDEDESENVDTVSTLNGYTDKSDIGFGRIKW